MNEKPHLSPNNEPLDELIVHYRATTPPEWVQSANRKVAAIAAERSITTVWWRQSIVVPLPVALAVAAMLLVTTMAALRSGPEEPRGAGLDSTLRDGIAFVAPMLPKASVLGTQSSVTRTYLDVIQSLAFPIEPTISNKMEENDDV